LPRRSNGSRLSGFSAHAPGRRARTPFRNLTINLTINITTGIRT
jgi:hypothetical protein